MKEFGSNDLIACLQDSPSISIGGVAVASAKAAVDHRHANRNCPTFFAAGQFGAKKIIVSNAITGRGAP